MKKILLLCLAFVGLHQIATAQSNWKVGKVGFFLTHSGEAYKAASFDNILNMAKNKEDVIRDLSNFEGDLVATVSGGFAGFQFMLTPPKSNRALLISPSISIGREMFVSQTAREEGRISPITNDEPYPQFEEAAYCIVENELKVDVAWLHYKKLGTRLTFYGGFGGSVGSTFNNDFIVMGTEKIETSNNGVDNIEFRTINETYESKNTLTARGFLYGGIGFQFARHFEVALDAQQGIGVQKAIGGPSNFLHNSTAINFGIRYVL